MLIHEARARETCIKTPQDGGVGGGGIAGKRKGANSPHAFASTYNRRELESFAPVEKLTPIAIESRAF